ncbi:MAG: M23 family metallopeptidase [Thiothrix sp.]|uniref:M23 family metallopeptidase n=1 Tax=Thiothrix sp. TaxID=1032 RepID=UPI00263835BB|nr:M23 family metallopeptidase [Thiothrix sp.]MDD5392940.1 M23 family metallopeptidase [Thiothrix sp.]
MRLLGRCLLAVAMLIMASCAVWANEPDGEYLYAPPFQVGQRFLVVQGFDGERSHTTPLSRYAVDLAIPEGEPVCAARSGVISDLYDGDDESISHFVHIEHEDQTLSDYEHLQKSSITVKVGQAIKQGDCFARVGNTGNSTGAHLHFAVLHRQGFLLQVFVSKPFRFLGKTNGIIPEYLTWIENPVVK